MLTEDYLIQLINQMVAVLAKIAGFKKAGLYMEALKAVNRAQEQLFGLSVDLIDQMNDEDLLKSITWQGQPDIARIGFIADLFNEQGDILAVQSRFTESRESHIRALFYYLEAGFAETTPQNLDELTQKIRGSVRKLGIDAIPDDILWTLFCFYEKIGAFAEANAALVRLVENPQTRAEIQPEQIAFYQRLLSKPANELSTGGLSRGEVDRMLVRAKKG